MATLRRADVLKPDERDHPVHYNRAFSSIHAALTSRLDGMSTVVGPITTVGPIVGHTNDARDRTFIGANKNLRYLERMGLLR